MTYDINNLDKFDEEFKCIQGDCDGYGHIPEQISEDEWTSHQCQFHAEYLIPIGNFILQDRQEAYNAGRQSGLEEVEKAIKDTIGLNDRTKSDDIHLVKMFNNGGLQDYVDNREYIKKIEAFTLINKLKQNG
jgi:hypothetical protein